jgi:hypothetical protein
MLTVVDFHRMLSFDDPTETHNKLYASGMLGFDDKNLDEERFLAVATLTLFKTTRKDLHAPERVILLVPPRKDEWAIKQLDVISGKCFKLMQKMPGTPKARGDLAKVVGKCFDVLFIMSRLLQLPEQPESWTSFGFSKEDPIPDWMRERLLGL